MTIDRGAVWVAPYDRYERTMLAVQAKYDRRNLPLTWYWRLKLEDDAAGGAPDDVLFESPQLDRRYHDPIGVHIYVDDSPNTQGVKKGVDETTGVCAFGISRAETRRLGELLSVRTVDEGLRNAQLVDDVFVPRAGDVFYFRRTFLYEVQETPKREYVAQTPIVTRWSGTVALARSDSAQPLLERLPKPPTEEPPIPEIVGWRR